MTDLTRSLTDDIAAAIEIESYEIGLEEGCSWQEVWRRFAVVAASVVSDRAEALAAQWDEKAAKLLPLDDGDESGGLADAVEADALSRCASSLRSVFTDPKETNSGN